MIPENQWLEDACPVLKESFFRVDMLVFNGKWTDLEDVHFLFEWGFSTASLPGILVIWKWWILIPIQLGSISSSIYPKQPGFFSLLNLLFLRACHIALCIFFWEPCNIDIMENAGPPGYHKIRHIHPWSLTWNLKINPWKRNLLLENHNFLCSTFRVHSPLTLLPTNIQTACSNKSASSCSVRPASGSMSIFGVVWQLQLSSPPGRDSSGHRCWKAGGVSCARQCRGETMEEGQRFWLLKVV